MVETAESTKLNLKNSNVDRALDALERSERKTAKKNVRNTVASGEAIIDRLEGVMFKEGGRKALKKFIDELAVKFLNTLDSSFKKTKKTSERLKILDEIIGMEPIIKLYNESSHYKINARPPTSIEFNSKDGRVQKYFLEIGIEDNSLNAKQRGFLNNPSEEDSYLEDTASSEDTLEHFDKLIEQKRVLEILKSVTKNMPESTLKELSELNSQIAQIYSNSHVNQAGAIDFEDQDRDEMDKIDTNIRAIMENYLYDANYPRDEKKSNIQAINRALDTL